VTRALSHRDRRRDVVVVGAGVIGLSCAWRLADAGLTTALVDPDPCHGASWVAAGMLAPVTEVRYGEEDHLSLNLAAAAGWPAFAAALEAASGLRVGHRSAGTLLAAVDDTDAAWLGDLVAFQHELGLASELLTPRRARQLEPGLAPTLRGALRAPGDHQVDNRRLLRALVAAGCQSGVGLVRRQVEALATEGGAVTGVHLDDGSSIGARAVVLAAGWRSAALMPDVAISAPVRPVKGQILRLRGPAGSPVLGHTVRAIVQGSSVYVVPRASGTVVVGATVEERGDDVTVTAGAVFDLLRDARRVYPGVSELALEEAAAGLRPGSPDNAPLVGSVPSRRGGGDVDGLVLATGHFRNGILLAPVTAEAVTAVVTGGEVPAPLAPFPPARFAPAAGLAC
jgi:glycine oxidase